MGTPYEMHVISNTHWDREWSANFQETRLRLVGFVDDLLDILDREPRYRSFLMDSQTLPIEDYLAARPENRDRVKKHVTDGRLFVGPWYTCPEEFCVNGESLARNLLCGHRVAREFGAVMKVGYSPFSYGQNSQMPQIYAGFGIDSILFYHGVTHDEVANEFIFEGADGTRLFASQMSSNARYNFYHSVYRPATRDMGEDDRLYTWDTGGLPVHACSEEHFKEQHFLLDPVMAFDEDKARECVLKLRDVEAEVGSTPFLAFMTGHDASVADTDVLRIIDAAQSVIGEDKLLHSTLPDWIGKVKQAAKDLRVLKGERRTPKVRTGRVHLYSDVLSTRSRMKRLNARAENALQRQAEPFAAMAWCLGGDYPAALLELAWKELLKGHAHDSIAGSGVDDIELDMNFRLRQVLSISRGVAARGMMHLQNRIDNSDAGPNDVLVTAFNPSPFTRTQVVTAVLDVPPASASREFDLVEADTGKPVPVQIATRKPHHAVVTNPRDAAHTMKCEQITFHFDAHDLPALGYATYRLNPTGRFSVGGLVTGDNVMENEHLRVRVHDNGTLAVTKKSTGVTCDGLHYFEDSGEAGQAWMHVEPGNDMVLTSRGFPVVVALEQNGPLLARYRIEYRMTVPATLDNAGSNAWERVDGFDNAARRSEDTRDLHIVSFVTLRKGARSVEIRTVFNNTAEDHRLRVMFPTGLANASVCHAETAFDVVERPIVPPPDSPWHGIGPRTYPMQRFIDVSDGCAGLAILNDGLREYEVTQTAERAIAVTLLRSFEVNICSSAAGWETHPDMKGSQAPGPHEFRYRIFPHAGRWDSANIFREVEALALPVELLQAGAHKGDLPKKQSLFAVGPRNLVLSALKRAEDGKGLVARVYNPSEKCIEGMLKCFKTIASAERLTLEETSPETLETSGESVKFAVGAKKIVTLRLVLAD
jgi:2-O-(6-phospho-alpha-D-mannosyl)-D-glycerate hydrolase